MNPERNRKQRLYLLALAKGSFYRYGEIGNLLYTERKDTLEGVMVHASGCIRAQEVFMMKT